MTSTDAVRIASRAIALYLFILAATYVISLLFSSVNLIQTITLSSQMNIPSSIRNGPLISLASEILRIIFDLAIGLWLYRCGPRIQTFFGVSDAQ